MDEKRLTENNNVRVYNETTKPSKKKRRDKSDLGDNFVAPDGGWAWAVCLAAGVSNLSIFPCFQQFGLVYRARLYSLGFKGSQISTIINITMAVSALTGLINGAMFRRFTFRQVAIAGGFFLTSGIFVTAFCSTLIQYIIFFSIFFGFGLGINMSATSLAVNTYFQHKRRQATGYSWTITGLGPIFFPHIVTWALSAYGVQGTIFILAAVSMNAIASALVLQPVLWHVKPQTKPEAEALAPEPEHECKYCLAKKRKRSMFSSTYTFNDDDEDRPGLEIITEPCTPMLSRANDGYFGSKISLATDANQAPRKLQRHFSINSQRDQASLRNDSFSKPNYFNQEREEQDRYLSKTNIFSKSGNGEFKCTCAEEKVLLQKQIAAEKDLGKSEVEAEIEKRLTFMQKAVRFFDLDLLRDITFVNLVLGMAVILFGEANFSILTPFILNDFKFSDSETSTAMSLIGSMDLAVRFLAPFALQKIKLGNRILFSFGIICICLGRFFITMVKTPQSLMVVAALVGIGKGFRTIFAPLILSSYVPLNRLPAASGLQLIVNGIFTFAIGPIVGIITDATSYRGSIHFINSMTAIALLSWASEALCRKILHKNKERQVEQT
ncbi:uncharacterized protein LOC129946851 [Eupeodes corollae]|uniref:uncharacterized protein LOC129946851 n=1 Tax=Eupeodes corollae TaxID=290404 RepID=UPI0024924C9B|nr:uncharacterized protein LOC129946851 [Eupeodes corollae]XP_055913188.1 uncharacterized protein LOC129946851 [Eupeodes corollae]